MKKQFEPTNFLKSGLALHQEYLDRLYFETLKSIYKNSVLLIVLVEHEKEI